MVYYPQHLKYAEIDVVADETHARPAQHIKTTIRSDDWRLSITFSSVVAIHLYVHRLGPLLSYFIGLTTQQLSPPFCHVPPPRHVDSTPPNRYSPRLNMGHLPRRILRHPRCYPVYAPDRTDMESESGWGVEYSYDVYAESWRYCYGA